jgi:uncharacterized protein
MKGPSREGIPRRQAAMFLDISRMRGTRDRVDRTYPPPAFDPDAGVYRVVGPVKLAFDVFKDQRRFRLVGRVSTALELTCSRCLEAFRLPLDAAFDLIYAPAQDNVGEGEIEIEDDDLSTAFYRDETIDLGGLLREQFLLALPMKPLCGDGCRGGAVPALRDELEPGSVRLLAGVDRSPARRAQGPHARRQPRAARLTGRTHGRPWLN